MPRKRCCGLVEQLPGSRRFIPDPNYDNLTIAVLVEEVEAMRLKDVEGLDQTACADAMGLSRATFQRILNSARAKVAAALAEGHAITIEGGNFIMKNRVFECVDCGHVWEVEPCTAGGKHGHEIPCPKCGSSNKLKMENGVKHACGHNSGGGKHGGCCCGHGHSHK